jgi:saccharopine dehydrogenase-like NADP-dependent oxidoreductase
MRTVVLGGYGNFGGRICRALAQNSSVEVIAAGRHFNRSAKSILLDSRIQLARIDLSLPGFGEVLKDLAPEIVIHCVGPFQGQDYRVASAAISAGAHYIDLADGREFVSNFADANNGAAESAKVLAVSGASTVPALSSAVVDHFAGCFETVKEIQIVIAPAQRAPRGMATMAGVLSYVGRPFKWLHAGEWVNAYGWQELRRTRIEGLGARWAAACDVPDLELFPRRYPTVETVEFRAALEIAVQHGALWLVSMLRRWGLPLSVERWALPLDRFASWLDGFGSELGGMLVSVSGINRDGRATRIEWHLNAPANHGPEIPCMASILLVQKLVHGKAIVHGATPCMGLLTLADFEPEFARWGIATTIREGRT